MLHRALTISILLILFGCAESTVFSAGTPLEAAHFVSVTELIGNSEWYDGEPVEVVGVGSFVFQFEHSRGIYPTSEDHEQQSYAFIFFELPETFSGFEDELGRLDGKWVIVSGVFRAMKKERLPSPAENANPEGSLGVITTCKGICGAPGYIEVHSVEDW